MVKFPTPSARPSLSEKRMRSRPKFKRRGLCGPPHPLHSVSSLGAIMRTYQRYNRPRLVEQLDSFRHEANIGTAVARAALARRPDGKKYDHQRRIAPNVLSAVQQRLVGVRIDRCQSFSELHGLIQTSIGDIYGVGPLMVYDTALRIGAKLGVWPEQVYLHRGTRSGARALRLQYRQPTLAVSELPQVLRVLRPHEVEDLLCVFKSELSRVVVFR